MMRNNDMLWWFEDQQNPPKWSKSLTVSEDAVVTYWSLSIDDFAKLSLSPKQLSYEDALLEDIDCVVSPFSFRWESEPRFMIIDRPAPELAIDEAKDVDYDLSIGEGIEEDESDLGEKLVGILTGNLKIEDVKVDFSVPEVDNVNHPSHYTSHPSGVECIEITEHYDFCVGNAIKYLWRAGLKQDADKTELDKELEDLKKAKWYIDRKISLLTKNKEEK